MALGTVAEELAKIAACDNRTSKLRERITGDFKRFINEKFKMPEDEGKWISYTSNRAATDARKLINILASAHLKLWIPLTDEDKAQRDALSKTERFPYGAIALRDSLYQSNPSALPLQESLAFWVVVHGWIVLMAYLYDEDDGKKGRVKADIQTWDIANTRWLEGSNGLSWVSHKRYALPDEIKDLYGEEVKPDNLGRVELFQVLDREEKGVFAESEWLSKPEAHGLDHVPVFILPNGSTPHIQSDGVDEDALMYVGESWAANNRESYDVEHRVGSYILTLGSLSAKMPRVDEYDSTKGGAPSDKLEGDPYKGGATIPRDISKGEKLVPLVSIDANRDLYSFWQHLQERLEIGGQAPVSYGMGGPYQTASGLNILRHQSLDNIKPFKKAMERSYVWLAHELVSQYKSGKFPQMTLTGIDGTKRQFKIDVKPEDIDDSWQFNAELQMDFPMDIMANVGMAVQATQAKILSYQTSRDKFGLVDDTDLEQQNIDREDAYNFAFIKARRLAAALHDEGDLEGERAILEEIERMRMERMMAGQQRPGVASQPGIPSPVRPSADTTALVPEPPPPEGSRMRRFLSRFGVR